MNRVIYFSRGGNTKKLAEAIADAISTKAEAVSEDIKVTGTETLFVGGSIYAGSISSSLKSFLETINQEDVNKVAVFSTSAAKKSAFPEIKSILNKKGVKVYEEEFYCKGSFLLAHRGRPNADDLKVATEFAKRAIQ